MLKRSLIFAAAIGGILLGPTGVAAADVLLYLPFTGPDAESRCNALLNGPKAQPNTYCKPLGQADVNGYQMWGLYQTNRV
ncbi:hypothetical protein [Nocardia arthritidis]|uniref:Uncharacterized protein n=1 Tax=Nocardia arthritidis TaxID=228602 RepID=A0A6G9YJU9_9NOCA|nr:hypothetical protein [Nocardia arthritidis]QIS13316.1 hypothetical protein F5544_27310 [Nocardia arthritidis]